MTFTTKLEVLSHATCLTIMDANQTIHTQLKDKNSIVSISIEPKRGIPNVFTVVKLDENDENFLFTSTIGNMTFSAIIKYDHFFASIQLPVQESTLERFVAENYSADRKGSLLNHLLKSFGDAGKVYETISKGAIGENAEWTDFYTSILIPAFQKFKKSEKVELSEQDTKTFIDIAKPTIGGRPMFSERTDPQTTGSSSSSMKSSSKPLPEELPKFDDEYELQHRKIHEDFIQRPSSSSPYAPIGDRDLHPFGQYPPMRPSLGPEAGSQSGGMIPDRNHPLFRQPSGGRGGPEGRGDHPPGSRYDDPLGRDDFDAVGKGLPGGMGLGRNSGAGPFGGSGTPFGRSSGFGGGFI